MPPSIAMLAHLADNPTTLAAIWKITATDSTVAAYAAHTRLLNYSSVNYQPAPVEPSRIALKLGLEPNAVELFGVFDSVITEADVQGGRWKNASVVYEFVNYLDLSMGSVGQLRGRLGEFQIENGTYRVEARSLSSLLAQQIGELTSPLDRNRRPEDLGVSMAGFTFATTVASFSSRAKFKVGYVQPQANYFQYGRASFTSGANGSWKNEMEIKSSATTDSGTRTEIELALPMHSPIAIGDAVTLIAGYDGTIEQARDKFNAAANFNGEPYLPGIRGVISYPE